MTTPFEAALREHFRTAGEMPGEFGGLGLGLHMRKDSCAGWTIPAGARAVPDYTYNFAGTDCDSTATQVIRLDTPVSCQCGAYANRTVQVEGTMRELLTYLLNIDVPSSVTF